MKLSDDRFAGAERLLTAAQALDLLDQRMAPATASETLTLRQARGRVLAADVVSDHDVPPHDNSAVDGYAFAFADLEPEGDSRLRLAGRAAAGQLPEGAGGGGRALRIFTGAMMAPGCDSVAMQEDCRVEGQTVIVPAGLARGANRRLAGENIRRGDRILSAGQRLRPQDIGLAASVGRAELEVYRPLRVAIFSTGDEIREPGDELGPAGIFDANRYLLMGLLDGLGVTLSDLGILPDRLDEVRQNLAAAARDHDLLITSGGVSVGDEDHVRLAVEELGRLHFWKLAIKPGRPLALGQVGPVPFVGLPGNPVAAMVTFLRFARPLILRLGGCNDITPALFRVTADFDYKKKPERREYVRARLARLADGSLVARPFEPSGSGILRSMVEADGLVELPEEMSELRAGSVVDFLPFNEVGS
ncbi:MAG TPA: gephyrin-like molybdotransferase Glp [Alphaproteobacteria bacterium]|jgi:molybdopterin molybdotransferase|nr:molybdopterin molybdotransferase MoeA [Alphaproteobacteria bacterium]MDP6271545.1 molybdopterin molybdotransferase MoeA [Alphaproteobacteria bacterium]MDP7428495.1 molybdopterin molybdotransferase MoeA [Alphaproteobacteria bacterium]HJM51464.1 gephyrin-like molybdotransferase Glp [Alphaproteobacteria bacterium]